MDIWQQLSPDLRTAIIDVLIVGVGVVATWLASRITRIKEHTKLQNQIDENNVKHNDEMAALKTKAEEGRLANETFVRDSAAAMGLRLDEKSKELQKARNDLVNAQQALQATREQFAHDSGLLEGKIQTLQAQNVDFLARLSQKDVQIADLNKQVADLAMLNGAKEKALTEATDKLTASDAENVRLRSEVSRLEKEVEQLKTDAVLLKARVMELENATKKPDTGPLVLPVVAQSETKGP